MTSSPGSPAGPERPLHAPRPSPRGSARRPAFSRYLLASLALHGLAVGAIVVSAELLAERIARRGPLSVAVAPPPSPETFAAEPELEPVRAEPLPEPEAAPVPAPVEASEPPWDLPPLERVWPGEAAARVGPLRRTPEVEEPPDTAPAEQPAALETPSVEERTAAAEREPAVWLEGEDPVYPPLSVRAGEEGVVVCRLAIGADGAVTDARVVSSSGHPRLDRAAVAALSTWRFRPAREGGAAVPSELVHRVVFRLSGAR